MLPDDEDDIAPNAAEPEHETPSAADPEQAKRIRNRGKREAAEGDAFWRQVLADKVGRREVWRLLMNAHAFEDRFAVGPNGFPQSEATWFQAGERSVGQRLYLSLLRIDHAAIYTMHTEHDGAFGGGKPPPRRTETSE